MRSGAIREGSGLTQLLRVLLFAVIIVPVLLFGIASWLNYDAINKQAWEELIHATDAIEQHAQKVLQTTELILDQIQDRTAPLNWEQISQSADLHRTLQHLADILGQNSITGVIGPDRTIVATDRSFPMPAVQAPERSYIEIPRANGDPLYISEVSRGNYSGAPQFLVAEHKRNPDGSDSGGIVAVSLQLSNFVDYYRSVVDSEDYVVTMTRSDGAILIHYPGDDFSPTVFPPTANSSRKSHEALHAAISRRSRPPTTKCACSPFEKWPGIQST